MLKCDHCEYNYDDIKKEPLNVCKECRNQNQDARRLMTKTEAKKTYKLNDNDLVNIRCYKYKGTYLTFLYLIKDLILISYNKHGRLIYNDDFKTRDIQKEKEREKRKLELQKFLLSKGRELREDSMICQKYIELGDHSGFSMNAIADILDEMDFYIEKTEYRTLLRKKRREEQMDMYRSKWTEDMEECLRRRVKNLALKRYIKNIYKEPHMLINSVPKTLINEALSLSAEMYNEIEVK